MKFETASLNIDGQSEVKRAEQEKKLQDIREAIEKTTDAIGHPIEGGIKESVVILSAFGLRTSQSCGGHPDEPRSEERAPSRAPWVEIYPKEPDQKDWYENEELRKEVEAESLDYRAKALNLFDEFYQDKTVPNDVMLGLSPIAYGFRIQSNGLDSLEGLADQQRTEKGQLYEKEMEDFTEFLKRKFLK
ncbi:MAG: hypothetical protein NTV48_01205 [Candidatus Vogelbacteria bacterium]|nr:hypothetical protein [Candidatus Vogelbacteria bacterium]